MSRLSPEEKRQLQLKELVILDELHRVCELNGLRYYITAGTLLGAVRHHGFIPWDDDADVVMPRRDYDRLEKIAKKALSDQFFYQSERTEKRYPFAFAKIRMRGTEVTEEILENFDINKGCYIDVFPLDKCPRGKRKAKLFFKLTELTSCAIIAKTNKSFVCEYEKGGARFLFKLAKALPRPFLRALRRFIRRLFGLSSSGKMLATVNGTHGYPRETYDEDWFGGGVKLDFEGKKYTAPREYKKLLTNMYGDYMTPPEESERGGHFIRKDGDFDNCNEQK